MLYDYPPTHIPLPGAEDKLLPPLARMQQRYEADTLQDAAGALQKKLAPILEEREGALRGKRIAVTVGSRGIPGLPDLVRAIGGCLREAGAQPFVVPCMGSHGGATAEGQRELLAGLGVTEERIHMPVCSSMETVEYGSIGGLKLYCDKLAAQADGIVVFNKIRPHTMFHGAYESGLAKMMAIGLGKHAGALAYHGLGFENIPKYLPKAEKLFLAAFHVVCGIGVVQNEHNGICRVEALRPDEMPEAEPELLRYARQRMARFPLPEVDVLILDAAGKDISGSGFDPNIFARAEDPLHSAHAATRYRRLYIRSITKESHHLGTGAFFSDFLSLRTVRSIDWSATWTNCVTCNLSVGRGIPIYFNADREAIAALLHTFMPPDGRAPRVLWAKNSLELSEFLVSASLREELLKCDGVRQATPFQPVEWDGEGYLKSPYE